MGATLGQDGRERPVSLDRGVHLPGDHSQDQLAVFGRTQDPLACRVQLVARFRGATRWEARLLHHRVVLDQDGRDEKGETEHQVIRCNTRVLHGRVTLYLFPFVFWVIFRDY